MPRVKRGFKARQRRNKVLKAAKGFRGGHSKIYKTAFVTLGKARQYAYRDRRARKRDFRRLWIVRINAAAREQGLSYSQFIARLHKSGIGFHDQAAFSKIANMVKQESSLNGGSSIQG